MGDREVEQIVPEVVAEVQEQVVNPLSIFPWSKDVDESYEYGDAFIWCRNCGSDNAILHPMGRNVQTAFVTQTPIDNKHYIAFGCSVCGAQQVLHFKKASNPPQPEVVESEEIVEETITQE